MNLNEFKAWFEGFTDGIDSNPTEKQWEKIKARVAEIKAEPTSPVVIREYWNNYRRYWNEPYWSSQVLPYAISGMSMASNSIAGNMAMTENLSANETGTQPDPALWQYSQASNEATFKAMGAADAAALN